MEFISLNPKPLLVISIVPFMHVYLTIKYGCCAFGMVWQRWWRRLLSTRRGRAVRSIGGHGIEHRWPWWQKASGPVELQWR
jgi:hypothetical protein